MRYAIPVVIVLVLVAVLGLALRLDPREVPSPLVGKPAPGFSLARLDGGAALSVPDLAGRPVLVNFWASWCAGCQVEHPILLKLARESGVEILGVDYKDTPEDARRWLEQHGNPYREVVLDGDGAVGLDWGVYGVPETFVLAPDGRILYKQIGPMTPEAWEQKIRPLIAVPEAAHAAG